MESSEKNRILVTGATGYIGGRLVARLLEDGFRVCAIGRTMDKLLSRSWSTHPNLHPVQADLLDLPSLEKQARGCQAGFYLNPSMNPLGTDFSEDYLAAQNFATASAKAGWRQLVFLKGIARPEEPSNPYLLARRHIESILRNGKTPVTSFHTDIVYGCGSVTFEIIRSLVHRFHLIVTQKWMSTRCRPIALPDLIDYLAMSLRQPEALDRVFDIDGPEWTTFQEMMSIYAREAGLSNRRWARLPVPTDRLGAYWLHMITPIPANPAYMLIANLRHPVENRDTSVSDVLPVQRLNIRSAMKLFVQSSNAQTVETHWSDAGVTPPVDWLPESSVQGGERELYRDQRRITLTASPENVWQSLVRIGGKTGWYYGNILWKLRGIMDRLVGGVGLNRGRRHPEQLRPGDALDLWRARIVDAPSRLMLVAEMKLPGKAILDFQLSKKGSDQVELEQTAWYEAHGILGVLYWYSVLPFHAFIFQGMLEGIAKATRLSYRYSYQESIRLKMGQRSVTGSFINISRGGCKVFSPISALGTRFIEIWLPQLKTVMVSVEFIDQYPILNGYHISLRFQEPSQVFLKWLETALRSVGGTSENRSGPFS